MVNTLADHFSLLGDGVKNVRTFDKGGIVRRVIGLVIESEVLKLRLVKFVP